MNKLTMEEPESTPKVSDDRLNKDQIFSSSPGFGTPAYPIQPRQRTVIQPFAAAAQVNTNAAQTILPIILPPQTLRPVAFRTLTKKHNLTLTSSGLAALSQFIGKHCGSGWREEGLAERCLDEVARQWKKDNGSAILDDGTDKKLREIFKVLEPCMVGGRLDVGKLTTSHGTLATLSRNSTDMTKSTTDRDDSQQSLGLSNLDVQDHLDSDEEKLLQQDARTYLKIISAFEQPRFAYSTTRKTLEIIGGQSSMLAPIQHKISMFKSRYHLVHQRLLRNESFQTPSFTTSIRVPRLLSSASGATTMQQAYKITAISNLLGRSGTSHLLLGLLAHNATGDLTLTDLTNSIVLDISIARPVPEDSVWFCPGMIVLAEGLYEEDGSNSSSLGGAGGIGGQVRGRFIVETIAGPPAERREITLGTKHDFKLEKTNVAGAGFGWIDFLGVGSDKAVGSAMRRIQRRLLTRHSEDEPSELKRTKILVIGECNLDSPRTLEAIRAILGTYNSSGTPSKRPLSVIFMGNFVSAASMAGSAKGGGSIEYKERFDALASVLSEFPTLLSTTTFVFVSGDNDPWASSFSAGAATVLPRQGLPELFTSRVRRAVTNANAELGKRESEIPGQAVFTSNPARLSLFGPVDEIVLFRDDITGRLRRNAILFSKPTSEEAEGPDRSDTDSIDPVTQPGELDRMVHEATSQVPALVRKINPTASIITARKLVKTILDQGCLSPFPLSTRPVLWDYASSLNLYPLPTALVLADAETPAFTLTYEGCHVMNPGCVLDDLGARKGVARFIEYDIQTRRGVVDEVRF